MISTGLQALIDAATILHQQAQQTAPGLQGEQPTIANQVMQQAAEQMPPSPQTMQGGPSQPQMQAMGRQAGIAGQLMAQQQAQQQQMAQNPMAIAKLAAQMMGGVGGLKTGMQFKDGGIVGYNGETGSSVPSLMDAEIGGTPAPVGRVLPTPDEVERIIAELRRQGMTLGRGDIADIVEGRLSLPPARLPARQEPTAQTPTPPPEGDKSIQAPAAPATPSGIATPSVPTRGSEPVIPDVSGIAAGYDTAEMNRRNAEQERLKRQRLALDQTGPNVAEDQMAARERFERERQNLLERSRGTDTERRLAALFRDLRTRGDTGGVLETSISAREEAANQAKLAHDEMMIKLRQAAHERKLGNIDKAIEIEKSANNDFMAMKKFQADMAKPAQEMAKEGYKARMTEYTHAGDRSIQMQMKIADLQAHAEREKNAKLANQISVAASRRIAIEKSINEQLEKKFPLYMGVALAMQSGKPLTPAQEAIKRDYMVEKERLERSGLGPIDAAIRKMSIDAGLETEATPSPATTPARIVSSASLPK